MSATPGAPLREPESSIKSYHAHIYWGSPAERERALVVRQWFGERFVVQLGTVSALTRSRRPSPSA